MAAMAVGAEDAEKLQLLEGLTKDVDSVQERVLAEILARNAGTEYLRSRGGPTDRATFRAKVPVVSYDDLKPYIQRIANGDTSPVLSASPVTDFFTSSGTSAGEPKLIPNIEDEGRRRQLIVGLLTAVINSHFPGADKGKGLYFMFVKPETRTPGGLTAWPALTSVYKSEIFRPALEHHYTSPRAACFMGINLRPLCDPSEVSYTLMPNLAYFEFLPVDKEATGEADARQLVDLGRVEAGRVYEVVVTTYTGLNRYRVGDVLRVSGFHNAAPQFQFVRRQNVLLSVETDKTDEAELQRAVERAAELLRLHGASVAEYTSRACTERIPGHYVVYWELLTAGGAAEVDRETLDGCCLEMEEALNAVYRRSRAVDGSIGPLEIRVVRPGTFEELMDDAVSNGASINQYKAPRCVTLPAIIELLDSRVVSIHFSPTPPHWTPARRYD
ncbi:hypothetical protein TRIUR3_05520 [Triticum urartu]|uniref:Indole-3-acetic acid-amido synthetase GH3.8 n=1 Tax=Triticum urartu TaxID=4572 RepID=M8AMR0_TRIUA|nr:hypothetical protein TRIUR3_05520 [Triticum urartu]